MAALCASVGFTAQFMGLRGLAFPCSIAQLGAIFAMALIRAGIRRRLGRTLEYCPAFSGYELDFLATHVVFYPGIRTFHGLDQGREVHRTEPHPEQFFHWRISTPDPQRQAPFYLPNLTETPAYDPSALCATKSNEVSFKKVRASDTSRTTPTFKQATS